MAGFTPYYNPYLGGANSTKYSNPNLMSGLTNSQYNTESATYKKMFNPYGKTQMQLANQPNIPLSSQSSVNGGDVYGISGAEPTGMGAGGYGAIAGMAGMGVQASIGDRGEYNQQYLGNKGVIAEGGQALPMVGGFFQLGGAMHEKGNEMSGELDEYGRPKNKSKFDLHQTGAGLASPSSMQERIFQNKDISGWDKAGVALSYATGSIWAAPHLGRLQRDAADKRAAKGESIKRAKLAAANKKDIQSSAMRQAQDVAAKRRYDMFNIPTSYY